MSRQTADRSGSPSRSSVALLLRAVRMAKPYSGGLAMACGASLLMTLVSLSPLVVLWALISNAGTTSRQQILNYVLVGIAALTIFGLVFGYFHTTRMVRLLQIIKLDILLAVFAHLQRLPLRYFDSHRVGELVYRLHADTGSLENAVAGRLISLVTNALMFVVLAALLLLINWKLSIAALVMMAGHVVLVVSLQDAISRYSRKLKEADETIFAESAEFFSAIRTVRALGKEDHEFGRFCDRLQARNRLGVRSNIADLYSGSVIGVLGTLGFIVLLWIGGRQVISGELPMGVMIIFLVLFARLFGTVSSLAQWFLGLQDNLAGVARVFDTLDHPASLAEVGRGWNMPPVEGRIEFRKVSFSYSPDRPVLSKVSFLIEPGSTVALVGPSGVGKTTVVNLILRFYEPDSGVILVDGLDIANVAVSSLRAQLGVVSQEPFLLHGTVGQNIAYGSGHEVSADQIVEAAKLANAHGFITALPDGYGTMLGERGAQLSAGEKQRITIARAMLRNPRILLLDEATSAQDLHSESLIQDALARLVVGRTTIVIAHRLSTIHRADRIFVMEEGAIAQTGTHEQLLAADGPYAQMYEKLAMI